MKWSNVKLIFLRECRDQLRDRRTLFTIAVLPLLLYPLLGMSFLQIGQFTREHEATIWIIGANGLPSDPPLLDGDQFSTDYCSPVDAGLIHLTVAAAVPPEVGETGLRETAEREIQEGRFDAVVYFPPDFAEKLDAFRDSMAEGNAAEDSGIEIPAPEVFVNSANDKSRIAYDRIDRILRNWRAAIVRQNLERNRISMRATEPFALQDIDVAAEVTRRAAIWSKILPFVVLVWALTGAFYPAVDLCAGEKERGTFETLLSSPALRSEIAWGKLLTIMTFSMTTSMLNLGSMAVTGTFIVGQMSGMPGAEHLQIGPPPPAALAWLVVALLPISALFSALSLAIAAFARSSKEGQYYLMPLLLICLPLMMLPMLPAAELDLGTSLIPITGMMLLLRALVEGHYVDAAIYFPPVAGVTVVGCLLAIRWAIDQFNNESVLFRESERWSLGLWLKHVMRHRGPTPSIGQAIACAMVLLLIRFFASFMVAAPTSWWQFVQIQSITMVALIATPVLLMSVVLTRSVRETLLLKRTSLSSVGMTMLLAIVLHPVALAAAQGIGWLYPISSKMQEQFATLGAFILDAPSIWHILALMAVLPAICEEIAFRGFILSGLRHMGHKWAAIILASVFFGVTHGILQQSINACAVGVVIGFVAVQTGSLLPAILFHMTHNALSLSVTMKGGEWIESFPILSRLYLVEAEQIQYHPWVVGLAGLLAILVGYWFRALPYRPSAEERLQNALDHESMQRAPEGTMLP